MSAIDCRLASSEGPNCWFGVCSTNRDSPTQGNGRAACGSSRPITRPPGVWFWKRLSPRGILSPRRWKPTRSCSGPKLKASSWSPRRAAIARARRDDTSVDRDHGSTALVAELTGREREFSAITTAWGAVRTGPARHLHLSAPAGHGKTWLLSIWLRIPSGTRRLTTQLRDDVVGGWLPDGSALVGMTDRWSQQGSLGYDIALFDTATGTARQITRGTAHEGRPFVSPDGTRIIAGRVAHHEEANTRRWRASRDRAC